MRIFTSLIFSLFTFLSVSAQETLKVDTPSGFVGYFEVSLAAFGQTIVDSLFCGELILTDPADGCTAISTDLTDKIAVIDRGDCEFGLKSLNAQMQGAKAVVLVNNVTMPFGGNLGGGANGGDVTIPVIMVELADGNIIKDAMDTETVTVCMGTNELPFNLRLLAPDVTAPLTVTVPAYHIAAENSAGFSPLARVRNTGLNDITRVTGSVTVDFTPAGSTASTQEYENNLPGTEGEVLAVGDTTQQEFPFFDYSQSEPGTYTVTYSFDHDSTETFVGDSQFSANIDVSENLYCKGSWNFETDRPVLGGTIRGFAGLTEMLSGYQLPSNANDYQIDSLKCYVGISGNGPLDNVVLISRIYKWDDASGNGDDVVDQEEITLVASQAYEFPVGTPNQTFVTLPVFNPITLKGFYRPENDERILVGVKYTGTETIFWGFDDTHNFLIRNELEDTPLFDLPNMVSTTANAVDEELPDVLSIGFVGAGEHLAIGMYMNEYVPEVAVTELSDDEANISLFPNPATDVINATVTLDQLTNRIVYSITDMQGRQLFTVEKSNIKEDVNNFNVGQLPTGVYNLTITTDKGIKTERFNVQH